MTAHDDLDRQLNAFLREGPEELPYGSFDTVRDRTEQTRQRVVLGPWRLPEMNRITVAIGAAAVVVIGIFLGSQLLDSPAGPVNVGASAEASASEEPSASASEEPSPAARPPAQFFGSTRHGISLSYPFGWNVQAATEPWTSPTFPLEFGAPHADWLSDPILEADLFLVLASQPIGEMTAEEWLAAQMASEEGCVTTEPFTVDGAAGLIGADGCNIVVVTTADRGYWIQLYTSGDDPAAVAGYDRAWFEQVLATVRLSEVAVAPPLTQAFSSAQHGIALSYPEGWVAQAATEPWTSPTFPLEFPQPHADWLYDAILEDHLFLTMASQPIGDMTAEEWLAAQMASEEGCATTEPFTVDGAAGLIGTDGCNIVVVTTADRGYWFQLHTSDDDPAAVAPYDRAWFEEVLATAQLRPVEDDGT